MPVSKEDFACGACRKRHEVAAANVGGLVNLPPRLECRALPPVQDVARHAVYPTVDPDFYCHVYFEADPDAVKARKADAAATAALDAKAAATQAAAQPELPLAEGGAAPAAPTRARRARAAAQD